MNGLPPGRGDVATLLAMKEFLLRLLNPEQLGYAVTAEVRDAARELLGMPKVET